MKNMILTIKVSIPKHLLFYLFQIIICDLLILGNFKELSKLYSKNDSEFEEMYLKKINLTSWAIQEDLMKLCTDQVKKIIFNELTDVGFFSIMCDEARYTYLLLFINMIIYK